MSVCPEFEVEQIEARIAGSSGSSGEDDKQCGELVIYIYILCVCVFVCVCACV